MKIYENRWKSMKMIKFDENRWKSWNPMKIYENLWKSMKFGEILWKSMKMHENRWNYSPHSLPLPLILPLYMLVITPILFWSWVGSIVSKPASIACTCVLSWLIAASSTCAKLEPPNLNQLVPKWLRNKKCQNGYLYCNMAWLKLGGNRDGGWEGRHGPLHGLGLFDFVNGLWLCDLHNRHGQVNKQYNMQFHRQIQ